MRVYFIIGRVLFGIPLIVFGIDHFIHHDSVITIVPSYLPMPSFIVYFTGVALFLAGISIITGVFAQVASALLCLLLVLIIFLVHIPHQIAADGILTIKSGYKDLFVLGGSLVLFYIFSKESDA